MNITSAQYKQYNGVNITITAVIDGEEITVPLDTANRHYAEILKQVESGDLTIAETD